LEDFLRLRFAKAEDRRRHTAEERTATLLDGVTLMDVHAAQQEITSSPYSGDYLELALATVLSLRFAERDGALIWLLGVGAPSSDKTESVLGLRQMPQTYLLDSLTENSFISGYVNADGTPATDLLGELTGKCLLIKDLTTLFSLKEDILKRVLGDLQSNLRWLFCAVYGH
jgi:hypothetical protein